MNEEVSAFANRPRPRPVKSNMVELMNAANPVADPRSQSMNTETPYASTFDFVRQPNMKAPIDNMMNVMPDFRDPQIAAAYQRRLGERDDGQWGPQSQFALDQSMTPQVGDSKIFASGKYQTIPSTLESAVKAGYVTHDAPYNQDNQEKVMNYLVERKRPQISNYIKGNGSIDDAMTAVAKEWASMPSNVAGQGGIGDSYYGSGNKAKIPLAKLRSTLVEARRTGDDSGFRSLIAQYESGNKGYSAYNSGTQGNQIVPGSTPYNLTNMSVGSILKAQNN